MRSFTKNLFVAAVLLTGVATIWAESGGSNGSTTKKPSTPQTIVLKPKDKVSIRPRTPSLQEVVCSYMDDYVYITLSLPEGECEMQLTDLTTGETVVSDFDSENPEPIYVGYHDSAEVTVTTAYENIYTGEW